MKKSCGCNEGGAHWEGDVLCCDVCLSELLDEDDYNNYEPPAPPNFDRTNWRKVPETVFERRLNAVCDRLLGAWDVCNQDGVDIWYMIDEQRPLFATDNKGNYWFCS